MKNGWRSLFDIKSGEARVVTVLLLHSFFMGIALVFFTTAASALFLARFPADGLPWVFISAAVVVALSGVLYNKMRSRLSTGGLWSATLLFLMAVPLAMTPVFYTSRATWPALVLMMFVNVMYALTALEFWGVAGRVLSLRQARRLYGLVGSGELAAGIIGGFAVTPILKVVSVVNLLLVAAGGFLVCLLCLFDLLRMDPAPSEDSGHEDEETNQSVLGLLRATAKDHYILLIVGLYLFYNLTQGTLEYTNLTQIQTHFHQDELHVAAFIGALLSAREIITLVARTLLSGWLLKRFGLGAGLAATPALMMAGSASLIVISVLAPQFPLFWLVVFLKIGEGTVRNSVGKPAIMMAYRPLAPQRRDRAQIIVETAIEPLSTGLTGAILLLVTFFLAGATPSQKAAGTGLLLLTTACGWLVMGWRLRHEYTRVVMAALSRGSLRAEVLTLDGPTMQMLTRQMRTSKAPEVVYLLKVMRVKVMRESMAPQEFSTVLSELLDHPEAEVRTAVLGWVDDRHFRSLLPVVKERLGREQAPEVRAALLRVLAAGGDAGIIELLSRSLEDSSPAVRRSALAGLVKYGGAMGELRAGDHVLGLLHSPEPAGRKMAAELIGEIGVQVSYLPLGQLLRDPHSDVRIAALEAAGSLKHAGLWPEVVRHLDTPLIWQHASRALIAGGDDAVPAIVPLLTTGLPSLQTRRRAIRVLGRIRTPNAIDALLPFMRRSELRRETAWALQDCKFHPIGAAAGEIDAEFLRELERAAGLNAALVDVAQHEHENSCVAALRQTLTQEIARSRDTLFSLLAFLYHPDSMRQARVYWRSGSPEKKTFALEVLDNLCARRHKNLLLPLLEDHVPRVVHQKLDRQFPQPLLGRDGRLREMVTAPRTWTTTFMRVWAIGASGLEPALLERCLADPEALVREAARRALPDITPPAEEKSTMLTIEKVLLLKSVEFFLTTGDDVLVELATVTTEVQVKAGTRIVEKGKIESTMYMVATGTVRVHEGEKTLAELGRGSVFGELAALDSQPRTADVTAQTDALLLRIDNATLVDLMAEHIDVAHGIIRFLIHRYRPATAAVSKTTHT